MLEYDIVEREFEPQSRYYVHFQTMAMEKAWTRLYSEL